MTNKEPIDLLLARQDGMEYALLGIALALSETAKIPMTRIVDVMQFMTVYAAVTHSTAASEVPLRLLERLRACAQMPDDPRKPLAAHLLMHADAGPHVRDAVHTWLAQATHDEITEDLAALLRKYVRPRGDEERRS